MRAHAGLRPRWIPGPDRGHERRHLAERPSGTTPQRVTPAADLMEAEAGHLDGLLEPAIRRHLRDGVVHRSFEEQQLARVVPLERRPIGLEHRVQLREERRGGLFSRETRRHALQPFQHREQLIDIRPLQERNDHPPAGRRLNQSLRLQPSEGVTDRRAADPPIGRELGLIDARPHRDTTGENRFAHLPVDGRSDRLSRRRWPKECAAPLISHSADYRLPPFIADPRLRGESHWMVHTLNIVPHTLHMCNIFPPSRMMPRGASEDFLLIEGGCYAETGWCW